MKVKTERTAGKFILFTLTREISLSFPNIRELRQHIAPKIHILIVRSCYVRILILLRILNSYVLTSGFFLNLSVRLL